MRRSKVLFGSLMVLCFVLAVAFLTAMEPTRGAPAEVDTPMPTLMSALAYAQAASVAHLSQLAAVEDVVPTLAPGIDKQRVTFTSDNLTLVGYMYRPEGNGPFPGIIWNHGSEKSPGTGAEFDAVADIFVPAGYAVFNPIRRGHGDSQGEYIGDQVAAEKTAHGGDAAGQLLVKLMETEQLDDQRAGFNYLKAQPYVDTTRLAVVGCSYGGIQTILGAEEIAGYKAAVAESPGAESWGDKYLQTALLQAVDNINIPVFLLHPEKDASTAPGYVLGAEFQKLGKPYGLEIYPPFGPADEQGHCFGGVKGFHIWGPDVLSFLSNTL